jgi:hypothetical protein
MVSALFVMMFRTHRLTLNTVAPDRLSEWRGFGASSGPLLSRARRDMVRIGPFRFIARRLVAEARSE